jgi:hypothetical protein
MGVGIATRPTHIKTKGHLHFIILAIFLRLRNVPFIL